jgi:hypothetical protein
MAALPAAKAATNAINYARLVKPEITPSGKTVFGGNAVR